MTRSGRLIVTLPGRTIPDLRREIAEAREDGADWVEIRVDRLSTRERRDIGRLFPSALPALATLRSSAEGGEGPTSSKVRKRALDRLTRVPFAAIDVELRRDLEFVRRHRPSRTSPEVRSWFYSIHLPRAAPLVEIRRQLSVRLPFPGVRKVVLPCTVGRCLSTYLPFVESLSFPRPAIGTTGPSGQLLRAESDRLRLPFTFCAPGSRRASEPVENSQIPVDLLASFRKGRGVRYRFGLLGSPVFRSLSPQIFHRFLARTGRAGLYTLLEVRSASELARAVGLLLDRGWIGLNVTAPLKRAAWRIARVLGPEARASGCANVLLRTGRRIRAENTDVRAILRRLREIARTDGSPTRPVLVLGNGGAARATLTALRQLGWIAELEGRRPALAAQLRREFHLGIRRRGGDSASAPELLVHATTVGAGEPDRLPARWLRRIGRSTRVLDWVSQPIRSPVARRAREMGADYEDGRRLLVYQAAEGFRIWTGARVPEPTIESTVEGLCTA